MRRRRFPVVLSCVFFAVAAGPLTAQQAQTLELGLPPQPTAVTAEHRGGQTFLTWQEVDADAVRYRVYRSSSPIFAGDLATLEPIAEVPVDSGVFWTDRYRVEPLGDAWAVRYFDRFVVEDDAAELAPGVGLCVWTPHAEDFEGASEGVSFYAVTSVLGASENPHVAASNSTAAIYEHVEDPRPVRAFTTPDGAAHVYVQFLDFREFNATFHAPNPLEGGYGLRPGEPAALGALAYAFPYVVAEPDPNLWPDLAEPLPVVVLLHGHAFGSYPANLTHTTNFLPAVEIRPVDLKETWWFGFARDHDYRSGEPVPSDARIANFTERRVLRMVHDLLRDPEQGPRVDAERVYVYGVSMGGTGSLAFAMRYPQVFAAAYASIPLMNFPASGGGGGIGWLDDVVPKWGDPDDALPMDLDAPGGWTAGLAPESGTSVYDWQDLLHQITTYDARPIAPLGVAQGLQDDVVEWATQGQPTFGACESARIAWGGEALDVGHIWTLFRGLPPTIGADEQGIPFAGLTASLGETVPGLSGSTCNPALPPLSTASYYGDVEWAASWNEWHDPPVDEAERWEMSLRTTGFTTCTVDVTPRRTQVFSPEPGSTWWYEVRPAGGEVVLAEGTATTDEDGLLVVPAVPVTPAGVRVCVRGEPYTLAATASPDCAGLDWRIEGATPNRTQWIFASLDGPTPGAHVLHDALVDLPHPVLVATASSDAFGRAAFATPVDEALRGTSFWVQAHEGDGATHAAWVEPWADCEAID